MTSTIQVFKTIQEQAALNTPKLRTIQKMNIGEAIRQGDIYIQKIAALPSNIKHKTANYQLAIGQTQGSRHIISPVPPGSNAYILDTTSPLIGPAIEIPTRWTLTHPEHGHFSLPSGIYQVTYQKDYAKERAEELRRVAD